MVAFSFGLLNVDVEKRDLNALWIDLDSRVVDERKVSRITLVDLRERQRVLCPWQHRATVCFLVVMIKALARPANRRPVGCKLFSSYVRPA